MTSEPRVTYRRYIIFASLFSFVILIFRAYQGFSWDYSINWTASLGMRQGISLYDNKALREIGLDNVGAVMSGLFDQSFTDYIGLPTTAIVLLPFTMWDFPVSLMVYRIACVLAFISGVIIAGFVFSEQYRLQAWMTGLICLAFWDSVAFSLELGQVDAWIVLALAISFLGIHQQRWGIAGIGLGIATLLKISPGLIIAYCLLKRQWTVVGSATATILVGLCLSLLPQQGADLQQFVFDVVPRIGGGSIHIENQALGAWLARLTTQETDLLAFPVNIGAWRFVGLTVVLGLLIRLYWRRRTAVLTPLDLGVLILLALLAGPITWDHYTSWAILSTMMILPYLHGHARIIFIAFLVLLALPVMYLSPEIIETLWWTRMLTGTQTIALLGMVTITFYFALGDVSKPGSRRTQNRSATPLGRAARYNVFNTSISCVQQKDTHAHFEEVKRHPLYGVRQVWRRK